MYLTFKYYVFKYWCINKLLYIHIAQGKSSRNSMHVCVLDAQVQSLALMAPSSTTESEPRTWSWEKPLSPAVCSKIK